MTFLQLSLQKFGGGAIDALEFSEALRTLGIKHEVIVNAENELNDRWHSIPERPVQRVYTYASSIKSFSWHTILFRRVLRLLHLIKRIKPSVIYITHFHPWVFFVIFIRKFCKFKLIYALHEDPFSYKEKNNFFFNWLEKFCALRADIVVVHSKFMYQQVASKISVPIHIIPLGAYENYFLNYKKDIDTSKVRFLFLGRIEPYKGLEVLLRAYEAIARKYSNAELTIAGKGVVPIDLKEKFGENKLKIVNSWMSVEKLGEIIAHNDVLILPYIKASQSGIVSIALAYGLPVIASRVGALEEQVRDNETGYLFSVGDHADLAKKMENFLISPFLISEFGKNSYLFGRDELSWKNGVESFLVFLRSQNIII